MSDAADLDLVTSDFDVWRSFFPTIRTGGRWVGHRLESGFEGRVTRRSVEDISINLIGMRARPHAIERPQDLVLTAPTTFALAAVQLSGSSRLSTGRHQSRLKAGDHLVTWWGEPNRWEFYGNFSLFVVRFPSSLLRMDLAAGGTSTGEVLPAHRGAGAVLLPFVRALASDLNLLRTSAGSRVAHSLIELFGASLVGASTTGRAASGVDAVFERATAHLSARLGDPALSVGSVAAALFVSPRQVQAAFAARGTTMTAWTRERRLEGARRALDVDSGTTIGAVARAWGFVSPAHFSRVFGEAHGCSPRQWRARGGAVPSTVSQ